MSLPRHIAIVMDGNGRWARARGLPRHAGHKEGVERVRGCVERCSERGIEALTVFAFSSENWRRPADEVTQLMGLFVEALDREVAALHAQRRALALHRRAAAAERAITGRIAAAEAETAANHGLQLQVAVGYGGRWDIVKAAQALAGQCAAGSLRAQDIDEERFEAALELAGLPEPDLFIRTGGERRISNFLLWNLAYTELYFTDQLWPDFDTAAFDAAIDYFDQCERRFGRTGEQSGTRARA